MNRSDDNGIVELSIGENFEVLSTITVVANNLTLRSGRVDFRSSAILCLLSSPVLFFPSSITSFTLLDVDFFGAQDVDPAMAVSRTAMRFNATRAFKSLRIERSSFVDFHGIYPNTANDTIDSVFGVVHFQINDDNSTAVASSTEIVVRDVLFVNSSIFWANVNTDNVVNYQPVRGSMLHLGFGSSTNTTPVVHIERVEVQNCSSSSLAGAIAVLYDQQPANLLLDQVSITQCTSRRASGIAIQRQSAQASFPYASPGSVIAIRNSVLQSNYLTTLGLGVVAMMLVGDVNVSLVNTTFADNVAFVSMAQALFIRLGVASGDLAVVAPAVVTIDRCSFMRNGFAVPQVTSTAGAVALVYGDGCNDVVATFHNCSFVDNNACTDCLNGPFFGGAIHVSADTYLAVDCVAVRTETLLVDSCVFERNSAVAGGAIGTRNSCIDVSTNVTIRNSAFYSNRALSGLIGDGGAIVSEVDETARHRANINDSLLIDGCSFYHNSAALSGGAFAVARGLTVYESNVALTITDSELVDNAALDGEQLSVALVESMRIENTRIIGNHPAPNRIALLNMFRAANRAQPFVNSTIRCPRGFAMLIGNDTNAVDSVGTSQVTQLAYRCEPCPATSYNMFGEIAMYDVNGTRVPSLFECHDCPFGARHNCSGGNVGTSQGYWSFHPVSVTANTVVHYYKCPSHYCCDQPEGCAKVDKCVNNRTGVLCGECLSGFTHAFALNGACVLPCSPAQVWAGNAIVAFVCAIGVIYTLARTSATSDGLVKVIVAFCNIAQVVISNTIALTLPGRGDGGASALSSFLHAVFATLSGLIEPQSNVFVYCPMEKMTSLQKLVMPLAVPVVLFAMWSVCSLAVIVIAIRRQLKNRSLPKSRHAQPRSGDAAASRDENGSDEGGADDVGANLAVEAHLLDVTRQVPLYRVYASLLSIFDFSSFILVGVSVGLLNTVDVKFDGESMNKSNEQCRLWLAGDVSCSGQIAAGAVVLLVSTLLATVGFQLYQRFRSQSILGTAIADVTQSAMAPRARLYNLAITARRAAVAFVSAFVVDSALRVVLLRTILLQALLLHMFVGAPYVSRWVNRADLLALVALLSVMLMQSTSAQNDVTHISIHLVQMVLLTLALSALVIAVLSKPFRALWRWRRRARPKLLVNVDADAVVRLRL